MPLKSLTLNWIMDALDVPPSDVIGEGRVGVDSVATDTRRLEPGALFVALRGESHDGHAHVAEAFRLGAAAALVEQPIADAAGLQLVVPSTLHALGGLAQAYRREFAIPVVGVTGSVGKTSTKEMIAAVLRVRYRPLASAKNYNNEIGVPQTLLQLDETHDAAILEMGMRGPGEIDRLAEIAAPTVGVITNIGYAHIERLGSQQNIARAKSELFARLPRSGIAIASRQVSNWTTVTGSVPPGVRLLRYSRDPDPRSLVALTADPVVRHPDGGESCTVQIGERIFPLRLRAVGTHHLENALAAITVAVALDVPLEPALAALEAWEGADDRMRVVTTPDGVTVLDDCYNAGPESMSAALLTLSQLASQDGGSRRTVAILGDMKELGKYGPGLHDVVGSSVVLLGVQRLLTVGELARDIGAGAQRHAVRFRRPPPDIVAYADADECARAVRQQVRESDVILVKGSRAMGMEVIVRALMG